MTENMLFFDRLRSKNILTFGLCFKFSALIVLEIRSSQKSVDRKKKVNIFFEFE